MVAVEEKLMLIARFFRQREVQSSLPPRPWMTTELCENIRLKHRLYRKYKCTPSAVNWENFRCQRNLVSKQLKESKSRFLLNLPYDQVDHACHPGLQQLFKAYFHSMFTKPTSIASLSPQV